MKRNLFVLMTLFFAALFTACGDMGTANTASKPTNTAAANTNTAPPADPKAAEADIRKVLDNIQTALSKNDADAMDKIYADNYMIVNGDGTVQTKAERLAALRSGETKYASFEYTDQTVRVNPDGNSAVGIARLTIKGTMKGKPMDGVYRVTGVYSKTNAGWKLMSASSTKITGGDAKMDDKTKMDNTNKMAEARKATGNVKVDAVAGDDIEPPKKR